MSNGGRAGYGIIKYESTNHNPILEDQSSYKRRMPNLTPAEEKRIKKLTPSQPIKVEHK
jgi:hypothetical protein